MLYKTIDCYLRMTVAQHWLFCLIHWVWPWFVIRGEMKIIVQICTGLNPICQYSYLLLVIFPFPKRTNDTLFVVKPLMPLILLFSSFAALLFLSSSTIRPINMRVWPCTLSENSKCHTLRCLCGDTSTLRQNCSFKVLCSLSTPLYYQT